MSRLFVCVAVALAFAVPASGASASARIFNDRLTGIELHSGTVTPSGGSSDGCKTQTFSVEDVALSDDHGTFNGTLTHYGFMLGGTCVVYSASNRGIWTIGG